MVAPQQQRYNDDSPQYHHNNYDSMRNDLQTTLGCEISNDWWEDCLGALSSSTTGRITHDLVLTQVLHSDLRDVLGVSVRRPFPPAAAVPPPLQEISNVHLLCQLEDWVDLSLGHENRLLQDNHNSHNNNSNSNTSRATTTTISTKSCYKLFLTHGSHSFVGLLVLLPSSSSDNHPNHPKTTASASSSLLFQAGSKVLIQSSSSKLKIRHGVWQLTNPGNLVVLGGRVAPLVQARTEALQKAQQLQGVGVDPTIRALIGTNHHPSDADDDEEHKEDEGEGESSDLPPATAPVAATVPRLPLVERPTPPAHAGVAHATSTTRALAPQRAAVAPFTAVSTTNAHVPIHHNPQHRGVQQPQPQRPTTTSAVARRSSPVPSTTSIETSTTRSLNPYASAISTTSMASTVTTSTTQSARNPQRSTTMANQHNNNPYSVSSGTIATHNSSPAAAAAVRTVPLIHNNTAPVPFSLPPPQQQQHNRPPQQQSAPPTTFTNPYASTNSTSTSSNATAPTASTTTTATSPQRIAFADLYQLLLLHLSEPLSISSHMSWLVEMKQWGANIHFNIGKHNSTTTMDQQHASNNHNHNDIDKTNKSKKKKKKEYCLEMHALFGVSSHQVVACQLPSRFVEPYFSVSPSALRALTRTDKAASHKITKEGGEQVKEVYFTPMRLWKVQLAGASSNNNNNNTNHSLTDVANPILTLEPVEG